MSAPTNHGGSGYERSDASWRGVFVFALGLALVIALVGVAMRGVFVWLDPGSNAVGTPVHPLAQREEPPGPRLQTTTSEDLIAYRARETEQLSTYGWIDREAGVVRLPIERAIDLVAERGLPVRK